MARQIVYVGANHTKRHTKCMRSCRYAATAHTIGGGHPRPIAVAEVQLPPRQILTDALTFGDRGEVPAV